MSGRFQQPVVRVLLAALLIVGVLGLVPLLAPGTSAPEEPSPRSCPVFPDAAPAPSPASEDVRPLMVEAGRLADAGELAAAERLYELVLEGETPDPAASQGLAYVEDRRSVAARYTANAKALEAAGRTGAARACVDKASNLDVDAADTRAVAAADAGGDVADQSEAADAADDWDTFYEDWLAPAARVVVPFLVVLAALLIVGRLLTSLAVPVNARAWRDGPRRVAWWVGLLLLALGALRLTVFAGRPGSWFDEWVSDGGRLSVVLVLLIASCVAFWSSRFWARLRDDEPLFPSVGVPLVTVLVLAAVAVIVAGTNNWRITDEVWPWLVGSALVLLGLALFSAGRGHAMRLQVRVKKAKEDDPEATAYVLARLQDLGSSPPRGLKAAQEVDVTELPTNAITSLSGGTFANAITTLIGLLTPSVPWRAIVETGVPDEVVVTVTRNGGVAQTAIVNAGPFRILPVEGTSDGKAPAGDGAPGKAPDVDASDLLTAAAAVILTELAERHRTLKPGLCGASRWQSVAAHVVATKPPESGGGDELRRRLLTVAVQQDPQNALARSAFVRLQGEEARDAKGFEAHADRLRELLCIIDVQRKADADADVSALDAPHDPCSQARSEPGTVRTDDEYTALRLRTLHALTASWLNAAAAIGRDGDTKKSVDAALASYGRLRALLRRRYTDPRLREFVAQFWPVADELGQAIKVFRKDSCALRDRFTSETACAPLSMHALYDRACRHVFHNEYREAIDGLRLALELPELRKQALHDPWLGSLREPRAGAEKWCDQFWAIVGPESPDFVGLPPFGKKGESLRDLGIGSPQDLLAATACTDGIPDLAKSLEISPGVVQGWVTFAELAMVRGREVEALEIRNLRLLAALDIRSVAALRARKHADLVEQLVAAADTANVRRPSADEVREWLAAARPPAPSASHSEPAAATKSPRCRIPSPFRGSSADAP